MDMNICYPQKKECYEFAAFKEIYSEPQSYRSPIDSFDRKTVPPSAGAKLRKKIPPLGTKKEKTVPPAGAKKKRYFSCWCTNISRHYNW